MKWALYAFYYILFYCLSIHSLQSTVTEKQENLLGNVGILHKKENASSAGLSFLSKLRFLLYTRYNPTRYQLIELDKPDSINSTHFDLGKPTKILVHGWRNTHDTYFPYLIKNAYLTRYDANVIIMDWSWITRWQYPTSRWAVPQVARALATFIESLLSNGLPVQNLHVIGFSLGAHVAGIAGSRCNVTLPRITGLDPALPMFSLGDRERLRKDSAQFVDVVHTCGLMLGFLQPLGHVDFYPNGGTPIQPGCGFDVDGECSHGRAYSYFIESILTPRGFLAVPCPNWGHYSGGDCVRGVVEMGEDTPTSARGVFYLSTASESPYALGR